MCARLDFQGHLDPGKSKDFGLRYCTTTNLLSANQERVTARVSLLSTWSREDVDKWTPWQVIEHGALAFEYQDTELVPENWTSG